MNIEKLLENQETAKLRWTELRNAIDSKGNNITVEVVLTTTVANCIHLARKLIEDRHLPKVTAENILLQYFIIANWASEALN